SIDDVLAATVIARCRVFAAIVGAQPAPTVSAPGDALQQSASFSHSTTGLVRFGMNVAADARLIGLKRCPFQESRMVVPYQDLPLVHGQITNAFANDALLIDVSLRPTLSVDVSAGIHRIGEHLMDRGVSGRDPTNLTRGTKLRRKR